jgi:hypothetical protein
MLLVGSRPNLLAIAANSSGATVWCSVNKKDGSQDKAWTNFHNPAIKFAVSFGS